MALGKLGNVRSADETLLSNLATQPSHGARHLFAFESIVRWLSCIAENLFLKPVLYGTFSMLTGGDPVARIRTSMHFNDILIRMSRVALTMILIFCSALPF